ncbi:phage tail protein [Paracandidimonas soli]
MFIFSIHTAAHMSLQRRTNWRHTANSRVGARAGYQYVGLGDETLTLPGWIAPGQMGSSVALKMLRDMGNTGKAFTLVDGLGVFHGLYILADFDETHTYLSRHGRGRKIEFSLNLTRIDEDQADQLLGDLKLPQFGPAGTSLGELL